MHKQIPSPSSTLIKLDKFSDTDDWPVQVSEWTCPSCSHQNQKSYKCCENCSFQSSQFFFNNRGALFKSEKKIDKFYQVFKKKKVFLPVVHVWDVAHALKNAKLLYDHHVDGLFLINNNCSVDILIDAIKSVRREFPDKWLGINILGISIRELFLKIADLDFDGLWLDSAMITEESEFQNIAEFIQDQLGSMNFKGLYFGGIAFKYQRTVIKDLKKVIDIASSYVDVILTSGEATGMQIKEEKLKKFTELVKCNPLGIASGVTNKNLITSIKHADVFIVGTYIEHYVTGDIVEEKLEEMLKLFQMYNEMLEKRKQDDIQ